MKIATFEYEGKQSWGIVLTNADDGREWVYEPWKLEYAFKRITNATNGYFRCLPTFWPENDWPKSVKAFLKTGDVGMERLRGLHTFLFRYIEQSDPYFVSCVGHPLDEVTLRVPVPDSRLFLGLVQNSPSFFRSRPERYHVNILPQAHQRAMTSVAAHGGTFLGAGGNVEVGIVIGKECYNVPIEEAYQYVAGYTVVYDSEAQDYYTNFDPTYNEKYDDPSTRRRALLDDHPDWYVDATGSWIGKGADSFCVCGPYITTTDEVGNPYDIVVKTLANHVQRDKSNTAGYLIGVERTVQFFSSFMTLHPGDILHLGTVGTDGVAVDLDYMDFNKPGCTIGAYIEKVGELSAAVYVESRGVDSRTEKQKQQPLVPFAQDFIDRGETEVDHFDIDNVKCMWTCFGNFEKVEEELGWVPTRCSPRMLNGPCGQLTDKSGTDLYVAPIATELEIACEMALVIKKLGKKIAKENAREYILGIAPVLSVCDMSIYNKIIQPATKQEDGIGLDYGRWGDGYQTIGEVKDVDLAGRKMTLTVGDQVIECNTDEYIVGTERTLEYLSCATTMLPGDVVTLGRLNKTVRLPEGSYENGVKVTLKVDGYDEISRTIYPFAAKK